MKILITTKSLINNKYKELTMDTNIDMTFKEVEILHERFSYHHPLMFVNFIWREEGQKNNSFIFGRPYVQKHNDFR